MNAHLEEQVYTKTKDIQAHILKTFGKEMGLTTIRTWLKDHQFSYKKPVLRPKGVDTEKQQAFIESYHKVMNEAAMTGDPVLFVDAVHPTQQTQATYGWLKKGKDKTIETTAGRKRVNLIGALNLENMHLVRKDFETINSPAVITFFKEVEGTYPDALVIHLIADRAGYNTSAEVEEFLKTSRITLHLLPARSPNLNPIERLWKSVPQNNSRRFARIESWSARSQKDEGRPFGIGFQEQVSNRSKRLSLRVMVVSVGRKVRDIWQVRIRKTNANEPLMTRRESSRDIKIGGVFHLQDRLTNDLIIV